MSEYFGVSNWDGAKRVNEEIEQAKIGDFQPYVLGYAGIHVQV